VEILWAGGVVRSELSDLAAAVVRLVRHDMARSPIALSARGLGELRSTVRDFT